MRHATTASKARLWAALRSRQLGVVFRRQVVLCGYIVDFYACSAKLIVEVDGSFHASRVATDSRRDRVLARAGYRLLRVNVSEVPRQLPSVLTRICAALAAT